jgi:hypothetical protein
MTRDTAALSARLAEAAEWLGEEIPAGTRELQSLEGDVKLDELDLYCVNIMQEASEALKPPPPPSTAPQSVGEVTERLKRDLELQDGGGMAYTAADTLYTVVVQGEDLRAAISALQSSEAARTLAEGALAAERKVSEIAEKQASANGLALFAAETQLTASKSRVAELEEVLRHLHATLHSALMTPVGTRVTLGLSRARQHHADIASLLSTSQGGEGHE